MERLVKVCGMREGENIRGVEALGVDMMGFIFYPRSPRYVDSLPEYMPTSLSRVGVFVNEAIDVVRAKVEEFGLDYVQLHGAESAEYCREIGGCGVKVIKAISVAVVEDLHRTKEYEGVCDMLLFDTKCEGYGGSGEVFDWGVLAAYDGATPFLLSGGLGDDCVDGLRHFDHPQMAGYDLNSRFESRPALKDIDRIKRFLNEIKR